jgi:hypothetical protein
MPETIGANNGRRPGDERASDKHFDFEGMAGVDSASAARS